MDAIISKLPTINDNYKGKEVRCFQVTFVRYS